MLSITDLRAYSQSAIARVATQVGLLGGALLIIYILKSEPPRPSELSLALFSLMLFLLGGLLATNVTGFILWRIQSLSEGPKRLCCVALISLILAAALYFYSDLPRYRSLRFEEMIEYVVAVWATVLGSVLALMFVGAILQWVLAGFRQQQPPV
ncbi:hypothetical protein [Hyphomicrobium sp. NDB2Meth4]|uniref:hypothetical protein n=1 Tax=Hyphomicrobium sp. NDB2Meth4 TaxID=1892846 RepID=UPI000AE8EB99|nr:hypothetical protein [Hyphomicrobium sp. NDB2Meth4]